jgi:hypothetical protein
MGSQHPLGANYDVACAEGFIEMVVAIVGNIKVWDDQQQNFDFLLARDPHANEPIFDQFYGLPLYDPSGELFVVYYQVNDDLRQIILLEALRA